MNTSRRSLLGFALGLPFALRAVKVEPLERPYSVPDFSYMGVPVLFREDMGYLVGEGRVWAWYDAEVDFGDNPWRQPRRIISISTEPSAKHWLDRSR